jgi:hypothetical protein
MVMFRSRRGLAATINIATAVAPNLSNKVVWVVVEGGPSPVLLESILPVRRIDVVVVVGTPLLAG